MAYLLIITKCFFVAYLIFSHTSLAAPLLSSMGLARQLSAARRVIAALFKETQHEICADVDWMCQNHAALMFINEARRVLDLPEYASGTMAALNSAHRHSMRMANLKRLFAPESRDFGCSTIVTSIILETTHVSYKDRLHPDIASLCLKRILETPEYYRINASNNHTETVLGVGVDSDGAVFCTQVFSRGSKFSESGACVASVMELVPEPTIQAEETPLATPALQNVASNGYQFKHIHADISFGDDGVYQMSVKCNLEKCFYCTNDDSRCISERQSIRIDEGM